MSRIIYVIQLIVLLILSVFPFSLLSSVVPPLEIYQQCFTLFILSSTTQILFPELCCNTFQPTWCPSGTSRGL